jgi:hypothetical protein
MADETPDLATVRRLIRRLRAASPEGRVRAAFNRAGVMKDYEAFYSTDLPVILQLDQDAVDGLLASGEIPSGPVRGKPGVRVVARQEIIDFLMDRFSQP